MSTVTNPTKTAMINVANTQKSAMNLSLKPKAGSPWYFDQEGYTFDMVSDPDLGIVYFDQVGIGSTVTNMPKN